MAAVIPAVPGAVGVADVNQPACVHAVAVGNAAVLAGRVNAPGVSWPKFVVGIISVPSVRSFLVTAAVGVPPFGWNCTDVRQRAHTVWATVTGVVPVNTVPGALFAAVGCCVRHSTKVQFWPPEANVTVGIVALGVVVAVVTV